MSFVNAINQIPVYLGFDKAKRSTEVWLDKHPTVNKIIVLANHIFRIAGMVSMLSSMPYSPVANFLLGLGASAFYWITIERHCQYKFAISSCLGAAAYQVAKPSFGTLISRAAFQSLSTLAKAIGRIAPLSLCALTIVALTQDTIDKRYQASSPAMCPVNAPAKKSCCTGTL